MNADLAFLHCRHDAQCVARVDKHFEGYCSLQWMEQGAVDLSYDSEKYQLRAEHGTTWFWPAFPGPHIRFHLARDQHSWNHRYAAFTGPRLESWKRAGLWHEKPQTGPRGEEHRASFDEMLALIQRGGPWGTRRAIHVLERLLLELAEARAAQQVEAQWLERSREFLSQTRDFSPNYAALARELGLGLSTLRRHFKAATGLSLHDALLQNRLDAARQLLGETELPLKQVAAQLGYRDVYFFSNQFKKLSGVTPTAYRRSRQQ
jgi:AraC-like DNA-binding protein